MDNRKIALVTCYFQPNYGSQLQAFATQKFFDDLKVPNETILIDGLKPEINKRKMKYFLSRIFDINTIKDKWATVRKVKAKKTNGVYARNLAQRYAMFDEYANTQFHLSRKYDFQSLKDAAADYKAFVVGSDQLWLPSNISADYYTLNFVPDSVPRISLATSFGISRLPARQAAMAAKFLPRIDFCSVREDSGRKLVKELCGRDVPVVCDPTLLFTAEEWNEHLDADRVTDGKYLFCYFLGNNPEQRELVRKVKALTGYKIVQLQHCDEYIKSDEGFPDEAPYNVGPREFIRYIRDAEFVFTDSFHSTVFSMLYGKKFFSFRRYNNDSIVSTNGRIYSLLAMAGLEDRLMTGNENPETLVDAGIDYDVVHERLGKLRNFTKEWLYGVLDKVNVDYDRG